VLAGPPGGVAVKAEPVDARFPVRPTTLHPTTLAGYALPPLPGPALGRAPGPQGAYPPGTRLQPPPPRGAHPASAAPPGPARIPQVDGPAGSSMDEPVSHVRIPQVDGPGSSSSDEDQPGPAYAPRTAHPSLPQPPARAPVEEDPEAINSDLDDPDEDDVDEEETANMRDIAFCTYDKVSRVRNKWKCTFKEGMMHINGKDYLFNKCTA
jgi:transcription initiation factor TFIIA large subunit